MDAGEPLIPLIGAACVALATASLGMFTADALARRSRRNLERRFARVVQGRPARAGAPRAGLRSALLALGRRQMAAGTDPEIATWLVQAGWRGRDALALVAALRLVVPAGLLVFACGAWLLLVGGGWALLAVAYAAVTVGYLAPKLALRGKASARCRQLREEAVALTHLLRVLYECGLSTEQALQVLATSHERVLPESRKELAEATRLVAAGEELAEATREVMDPLRVPEFVDLFGLVRQIDRFGGGVQESLLRYAELLEDRERTRLHESVGRLSAKMTLVMVTFLVPALLVFVGGPGFTAIIRALRRMNG